MIETKLTLAAMEFEIIELEEVLENPKTHDEIACKARYEKGYHSALVKYKDGTFHQGRWLKIEECTEFKTKQMSKVLKDCTIEGNVVKLPNTQLDRQEYLEVKKALELIGGKWKGGKISGFVFATDPTDLLNQVANGGKRNLKKEFQFFATPEKLANELVHLADLKNHDTILEPSAGQGAIIKAINQVCDCVPDCYELMDTNVLILNKSGLRFNLVGGDFLKGGGVYKVYTKIIANPPFTKNQDIDHLKKMYDMLARGGRLVCITSESWVNGSQKKQVAFRDWLNWANADVIDIEKGAFKESGTMVGGKIVVIDKPL